MFWIILVAAYLMGCISGARATRAILSTKDPLKFGSGNPGATNMYRIAGHKAAAMTLAIDIIKAIIPVWLAFFILRTHPAYEPVFLGFVAIAVCLGHIFPVFHRFQGGKGVATALGALAPLGFEIFGLLLSTWLLTIYKTRYSSLASVITAGLAPFYVYFLKPKYIIPVVMLSLLVIVRHQANIKRLIDKEERTMDEKELRAEKEIKKK